jgi:hypothetical protein
VTSGIRIVQASWWGTAVFTVTAIAATVAPNALGEVAFVVAVVLFFAGCAAFVAAYTRAVSRSRHEAVAVSNLFFLTGDTAPPAVRRSLLGSLAVQGGVALATAIARPYTSLAAGTLVPVYGLALCGLWASHHGKFAPRASR